MKKARLFFKSFYLSAVILFCIFFGIVGTARAYEKTRLVGFGEYRKAVELDGNILRILDFEIELFN